MSHSANDNKTTKQQKRSSIKSKDTLLWEVLCPTKTKPKKTKQKEKQKEGGKQKRLLFRADVSLADEPRWQWLEAAKLKGDTCSFDRSTQASTIRNKEKPSHCATHGSRWSVLSGKHCQPQIVLCQTCKCLDAANTFFSFLFFFPLTPVLCDYLWLWCR